MSSRAAWRLESLGFSEVYRYTAGKVDWRANGLPTEGEKSDELRIGQLVKRNVPTCFISDPVGDALQRANELGWGVCPVVNAEKIILGMLWQEGLSAGPESRAEEHMQPGPQTFRPDVTPEAVRQYFRKREYVLVATSDGELIGILRLADLPEIKE